LNYFMKKRVVRIWLENQLASLLEKHDASVRMIRERASQIHKQFKQEKGLVVLRAYYGSKKDILTHLDLNVGPTGNWYWDDRNHRVDEEFYKERVEKKLHIVNVTIPVRFRMDPRAGTNGGIIINSGCNTKQFQLGFFNPIPSGLSESETP